MAAIVLLETLLEFDFSYSLQRNADDDDAGANRDDNDAVTNMDNDADANIYVKD